MLREAAWKNSFAITEPKPQAIPAQRTPTFLNPHTVAFIIPITEWSKWSVIHLPEWREPRSPRSRHEEQNSPD